MENAINLGTVLGAEKKQRITIHAPFMHLTKAEEVKLGVSLGVDLDVYKRQSLYFIGRGMRGT